MPPSLDDYLQAKKTRSLDSFQKYWWSKNFWYSDICGKNQMILIQRHWWYDQRILQSDWMRGTTSHTQTNGNLRYCFPLITNYMQIKLTYHLILTRDIDDQRTLQSNWTRGTTGQTKSSSPRCYLCLITTIILRECWISSRDMDDQRIM